MPGTALTKKLTLAKLYGLGLILNLIKSDSSIFGGTINLPNTYPIDELMKRPARQIIQACKNGKAAPAKR